MKAAPPRYADCACGKRVQLAPTGKIRTHALPAEKRAEPRRHERCPASNTIPGPPRNPGIAPAWAPRGVAPSTKIWRTDAKGNPLCPDCGAAAVDKSGGEAIDMVCSRTPSCAWWWWD